MRTLRGIQSPLIRPIFGHSCPPVGPGGAQRQPTISSPRSSCVARCKARRVGPISPPSRHCSSGDWDGNRQRRLLPVRQLDFRDSRTARIFGETHNLGNWVVNFDELLDRRQLLNQGVRVIRYKQSATQGRNLIISSRAPLGLLRSMVLHRLRVLGLDLSDGDLQGLADRLIEDANDVSGDIVLRAAKRGQSASELIGVALSRHLVREELGRNRHCGWYFLDDYAAWVGQREEQLADILAISPQETADGALRVNLVVTEGQVYRARKPRCKAERVAEAAPRYGPPAERRHISETLSVFERESWLARLSDLVLDGIRLPAASGIDLGKWRRAIREGRCEFDIRGYSHIFVPTTSDGADCTDVSEVPGAPNAFQKTYGRPALKKLLQAYWQNQDTRDQRGEAGADYLAQKPDWKQPGSGGPDMPSKTQPACPSRPAPEAAPAKASKGMRSQIPETASRSQPDVQPDAPAEVYGWAYPAIGQLLSTSIEKADEAGQRVWLTRLATATKSALQQIQLQAKLLDSALTPNSALLKFAGSARHDGRPSAPPALRAPHHIRVERDFGHAPSPAPLWWQSRGRKGNWSMFRSSGVVGALGRPCGETKTS